jgi:flagellar protein FliO/FliZ
MRIPVWAASAAVTSLFLAAPAHAAGGGENAPLKLEGGGEQAASSGGGGLARTFVGLAIVIAVIYGLYWVLKQVKASREEKAVGSGLSTISTLPLGPNRSLHLVRAGSEVLVVGVTEQGVTPIRSYSEREALEQGLLDLEGEAVEQPAVVNGSARLKRPLALPSAFTAANGRTAIETIRGWTVRG